MHLQVSCLSPIHQVQNPGNLSLPFPTGHQGRGLGGATRLWAADLLPGPSTEDRGHIQRNSDSQNWKASHPGKSHPPQYSQQLVAQPLREHLPKRKPERVELSPGVPAPPPLETGVDSHMYLLPVGVLSRTLTPVIGNGIALSTRYSLEGSLHLGSRISWLLTSCVPLGK